MEAPYFNMNGGKAMGGDMSSQQAAAFNQQQPALA